MAEIQRKCDSCQQNKSVSIGQGFDYNLFWHESHRCNFCGFAMEMDDRGFPPEDIRQIIIQQEGEYYLKVDDSCLKFKVASVKIIRSALFLPMSKTKKLLQQFPILATGTKIEIEWLQMLLLKDSVVANIIKKNESVY